MRALINGTEMACLAELKRRSDACTIPIAWDVGLALRIIDRLAKRNELLELVRRAAEDWEVSGVGFTLKASLAALKESKP